MSIMKQSKLDFSATKRKGSGTATGKPKAVQPQASTSREISTRPKSTSDEKKRVPSIKKEDSSSEEEENIEDFEGSPIESEEIEEQPTPTSNTARTTRSSAKRVITTTTHHKNDDIVEESSPQTTVFRPSNAKTEDILKKVEANTQKTDELPHLNVNNPKYRRLYAETREKMGGLPMIHGGKQTKVHEILRVFDNSYEYGPCVGMTRRERWDRAQTLGLNPPKEIDEILKTKEGSTNPEFVYNIFHGQV